MATFIPLVLIVLTLGCGGSSPDNHSSDTPQDNNPPPVSHVPQEPSPTIPTITQAKKTEYFTYPTSNHTHRPVEKCCKAPVHVQAPKTGYFSWRIVTGIGTALGSFLYFKRPNHPKRLGDLDAEDIDPPPAPPSIDLSIIVAQAGSGTLGIPGNRRTTNFAELARLLEQNPSNSEQNAWRAALEDPQTCPPEILAWLNENPSLREARLRILVAYTEHLELIAHGTVPQNVAQALQDLLRKPLSPCATPEITPRSESESGEALAENTPIETALQRRLVIVLEDPTQAPEIQKWLGTNDEQRKRRMGILLRAAKTRSPLSKSNPIQEPFAKLLETLESMDDQIRYFLDNPTVAVETYPNMVERLSILQRWLGEVDDAARREQRMARLLQGISEPPELQEAFDALLRSIASDPRPLKDRILSIIRNLGERIANGTIRREDWEKVFLRMNTLMKKYFRGYEVYFNRRPGDLGVIPTYRLNFPVSDSEKRSLDIEEALEPLISALQKQATIAKTLRTS